MSWTKLDVSARRCGAGVTSLSSGPLAKGSCESERRRFHFRNGSLTLCCPGPLLLNRLKPWSGFFGN